MVRNLCTVLCAVIAAGSAAAQSPPPSDADHYFDLGRELADEGKYAEACDAFQHSLELDRSAGTELNLGDCHEKQGHVRQAWEMYTAAADDYDHAGNATRARFARDRATAVAAKLATIIVKPPAPAPAGLAITIGGREMPPGPEAKDRVEPGTIEIVATVPDHPPYKTTTPATAGTTVVVALPAFYAPPPPLVEPPQIRRRSWVHASWALGGVGLASAITSGALTWIARDHYTDAADGSHCHHVTGGITCDSVGGGKIRDAQHLADIGTGFAVGAGVMGAIAVIVFAAAPHDAIQVAPIANGRTIGLSIAAPF